MTFVNLLHSVMLFYTSVKTFWQSFSDGVENFNSQRKPAALCKWNEPFSSQNLLEWDLETEVLWFVTWPIRPLSHTFSKYFYLFTKYSIYAKKENLVQKLCNICKERWSLVQEIFNICTEIKSLVQKVFNTLHIKRKIILASKF